MEDHFDNIFNWIGLYFFRARVSLALNAKWDKKNSKEDKTSEATRQFVSNDLMVGIPHTPQI